MNGFLRILSLIVQIVALLFFAFGDKQVATYLMAQAAFTAALVNWE